MKVGLDVPDGFERVEVGPAACVLRRIEPDPGGFRANVVVTVEGLERDASPEERAEASLREHEDSLDAFHVIDAEPDVRLAGRPASRLLAHHATGGRALVLEQWRVPWDERLVTVSATCPALDWPRAAVILEAVAETLRLDDG